MQSPNIKEYNLIKLFIVTSNMKAMTKTKLQITYISSANDNSIVKSFKNKRTLK